MAEGQGPTDEEVLEALRMALATADLSQTTGGIVVICRELADVHEARCSSIETGAFFLSLTLCKCFM